MSVGHYENFPVASLLLPPRLREPIAVIYRFARTADDFADEGDLAADERLARLQAYRDALGTIAAGGTPTDPLLRDLARIIAAHRLPLGLFEDLLDAFTQDVTQPRYADFAALLEYCRRSANPIGRLLLHLFQRTSEENLRASDAICSGLQLTNFWQDVAIDYAKQRIYLPQDEMARFGVDEQQIAQARCDDAWRALIGFQIERTRGLLLAGAPLGRHLPGRVGLEIRLTVQGGLRILERLTAAGADMFRRRPTLRWFDWPILLGRAL